MKKIYRKCRMVYATLWWLMMYVLVS